VALRPRDERIVGGQSVPVLVVTILHRRLVNCSQPAR